MMDACGGQPFSLTINTMEKKYLQVFFNEIYYCIRLGKINTETGNISTHDRILSVSTHCLTSW